MSPTDASLPTTADRRKTLIAFDSQLADHLPWRDCGTPTADMLTTKILLNSVISTKEPRFMTIDIKDFYLNTPMVCPEYMRLKLSDIPDHIIKLYKLDKLVTADGYVYVMIQKGMYGLPQAGIIVQQLLEKMLALKGYWQSSITPGFWKPTGPISFTLCVDDFDVKYVGIKHAHHLLQTLNEHYETSQDWKGERYLRLTVAWDYTLQQVQLSMPGYCKKPATVFTTLFPLNHSTNPIPIHPLTGQTTVCRLRMTQRYSQHRQNLHPGSHQSLPATTSCGLHHTTCAGVPRHPTIGPNTEYHVEVHQFLDYAMTHPDAMITYHASNMILAVHSDTSYLSETKARSGRGHFFLSEDNPSPQQRHLKPRTNHQTSHVFSS
eukprot:CCRYP_001785-RA/>CCRYP_001785-RA protein AED:0.34 eAED:0.34 QI:0/0/0/1/0/0/2/0/376